MELKLNFEQLDTLVSHASKLFFERKIELNEIVCPSKTKKNVWNDISLYLFKKFTYKSMFGLWMWWRRDTNKFRSKVIDCVNELKRKETLNLRDSFSKNKKITGVERSKLALKLEATGTYNVINQIMLEENQKPKPKTFENILYESRHKQDRLSHNHLIDAIGSYWNDKDEHFIHNIGLNPFGALFTSKYQVRIIFVH
jgi:hypothetical protein